MTGDPGGRPAAAAAALVRLPLLVSLAFLAGPMLSMIDSSVVNVAVPVIVRGLHTSLGAAAWAVSGYLLGLACGLAATPWLARRFGTLRAYGAALVAFTVASAACAAVPSVGLLIAARAVQGLVGAPMVPLAMSLIIDPKRGARGMPVSAAIIMFAAPALGPAVGGLLISATGWRGVFLVNIPIGIGALAAVLAGRRAVPGGTGERGARLDVPGLVVLGVGLGLATYGASQGPAHGWLSLGSAPAWAGGLVLVAGYVLRDHFFYRDGTAASRRPPAAVSLGPLRTAFRALTLALASVTNVVLFAVLFLAPVFLQQIQHRSTTVTGLVLLPQGVVMGLTSWLGNEIIKRGKARPALITASVSGGLALLAASTLGLLLLTPSTPAWATMSLLCGRGVALGLTVQPLLMAFLADLDPGRMPDANTLFNMAARLSGSFGIALLATLYASRAAATGSAVTAFRDCALVLTGAALAGALAALALPWRRAPAPGPGPELGAPPVDSACHHGVVRR